MVASDSSCGFGAKSTLSHESLIGIMLMPCRQESVDTGYFVSTASINLSSKQWSVPTLPDYPLVS